jgi:serine/threonine protein kinase
MMLNQKKTIGQGGQAKIRKYYSPKFKKDVVEKVINVNKSTRDNSVYLDLINKINLIKEAMLLSQCNYPNIVKIYDFTKEPFTIIMEYCDKGSLRSIIDKGFKLPPLYKIFLIYSICDALGYIHYQGIIHGDLKCDNILLSTEKKFFIGHSYYPIPKLADFGLSQIKPNKIIAGTPGFIAPEIYKGSGLTKETDIFALGMVMFEILSGLRPFPSDMDLAMKYLEAKILPCTKEVLRIAWDKRIEALLPGINNAYYDAFYTLMILCIDDNPKRRPDILTLFLTVRKLYLILLNASKEIVHDETEIIKKEKI